MPSDWIHSRDSAFRSQASDLVAIIASYAEVWGLTADELLPLQQYHTDFEQALTEQAKVAAAYHAIVATKQSKRERLERTLRAVVRRINNHPGMTDELRQRMGVASPTRKPMDGARPTANVDRYHSEYE